MENKPCGENDMKLDLKESSRRKSTGQDELTDEDGSDFDTTVNTDAFRQMQRTRTSFTTQQLCVLEEEYKKDGYLTRTRKMALSKALKLSENTIKIWFQNRRMKHKRRKTKSPESPRTPYQQLEPYINSLNQLNFNAYNPYALRSHELAPQPEVLYSPAAPYPYHVYLPFQPTYNCNDQCCNVFPPEKRYFDQFMPSEISSVSHIQALQDQVSNAYSSCSLSCMRDVAQYRTEHLPQDSTRFNYNPPLNACSTSQDSSSYSESSSPNRYSEVFSPTSPSTCLMPYVSSSIPSPKASLEMPQTISTYRISQSFNVSTPQKSTVACVSTSSNEFPAALSPNVSSTSQNDMNKTNSKIKFFRPFEDN